MILASFFFFWLFFRKNIYNILAYFLLFSSQIKMYIVSNYSVLLFRKDAKNIPLCLNKIARYKKNNSCKESQQTITIYEKKMSFNNKSFFRSVCLQVLVAGCTCAIAHLNNRSEKEFVQITIFITWSSNDQSVVSDLFSLVNIIFYLFFFLVLRSQSNL